MKIPGNFFFGILFIKSICIEASLENEHFLGSDLQIFEKRSLNFFLGLAIKGDSAKEVDFAEDGYIVITQVQFLSFYIGVRQN